MREYWLIKRSITYTYPSILGLLSGILCSIIFNKV